MHNYTIDIYNHERIGSLDLFDEMDIEIIYQISDIQEPTKRKFSYVREFEIPSTTNNRNLLQPLFDNGYDVQTINPNLSISCSLSNGNLTFEGVLQIAKVSNVSSGGSFTVAIYSKILSLFKDIGQKKLRGNIDLSKYNHFFNIENIENSWENKIIRNQQQINAELGTGYVYPMEDRANTFSIVEREIVSDASKWRPAIYVKTLLDEIFNTFGRTYESDFFNSNYFKSLIIPFSNERLHTSLEALNEDDYNRLENDLEVGYQSSASILLDVETSTKNLPRSIVRTYDTNFDNIIQDENQNFNLGTQTWVAPVSNTFSITCSNIFYLDFDYSGDFWGSSFYLKFKGNDYPSVTGKIYKNNQLVETQQTTFVINSTREFNRTEFITKNCSVSLEELNVLEGDVIRIEWELEIPQGKSGGFPRRSNIFWRSINRPSTNDHEIRIGRVQNTTINSNSLLITRAGEDEIGYGDLVVLNNALPDFTIVDLFRALNDLFNLQWQDFENEDVIRIEPYERFYDLENIEQKDWTNLVDRDEGITIIPMSDLTKQEYEFTYTNDNDWANKEYEDANGKVSGTRKIEIQNDFVDGKETIKPLFSSTIITELELGEGSDEIDGLNSFLVPSYTKKESNGNKTKIVPNYRILFWGGLKQSPQWNMKVLESVNENLELNWLEEKSFTEFPYAGPLDNPITPSQSLNYAIPSYYLHRWESVTNSNLFNNFWRNWMLNITDPSSHLLNCTIEMNALEQQNFKITDIIQIDNSVYRINKCVINPQIRKANLELLKLVVSPPFSSTLGYRNNIGMREVSSIAQSQMTAPIGASNTNQSLTVQSSETPSNYWVGTPLGTNTMPTLVEYEPQNAGTIYPVAEPLGESFVRGEDELPYILNSTEQENGNRYLESSLIDVRGFNNSINGRQRGPVSVRGNQNSLGNNLENVHITGNKNFIESGLRNVTLIGDNQYVSESNITKINGVTIKQSGFFTKIDLLQGGRNEIQNPFSPVKPVWKVNGGQNSVINLGNSSYEDLINGNKE